MAGEQNIRILVEGGLDYFLLHNFLRLPKKILSKQGGKGNIASTFEKLCQKKTLIGIVDDDNGQTININFKKLNLIKLKKIDQFTVYRAYNCYLIVLCCPEIEDWIDNGLKSIGRSLKDFGYKNIKDFKSKTKTEKVLSHPDQKIKNLLTTFTQTSNYQELSNFLQEIIKT